MSSLPRLYVSGPMTGIPEFNHPAFNAATAKLRRAGFDVINPAEVDAARGWVPGSQSWEEYMRVNLLDLLTADALAVLPRHEHSRGATLEIHVARKLGWQVQPVGFWLGEVALPLLQPGQLLRAAPPLAPVPPTPPPPPATRICKPAEVS